MRGRYEESSAIFKMHLWQRLMNKIHNVKCENECITYLDSINFIYLFIGLLSDLAKQIVYYLFVAQAFIGK